MTQDKQTRDSFRAKRIKSNRRYQKQLRDAHRDGVAWGQVFARMIERQEAAK